MAISDIDKLELKNLKLKRENLKLKQETKEAKRLLRRWLNHDTQDSEAIEIIKKIEDWCGYIKYK